MKGDGKRVREIKFRAWDKDKKCFLPCIVGNTDIKDNNWICPLTFCEVNGVKDWYHNDTCEVMQYTGLHDKNGKEIYEGDIVSIPIYKPMPVGKVTDSLYKVVWNDDEARFDYIGEKNLFGTPCCSSVNQNITEIIGNVFENPELLESEV